MVVACSRKFCLGLAEVRLKLFTLVCRDIMTLMTTASLALHTTSDELVATHCTIFIVSTLVTPNLATTRMSHCLLHHWPLTLQMTSKFFCSYEFHAFSLTKPPHLTHPILSKHPSLSPPPPPIGSLPFVVELRIFPLLGLDKEIFNSPHFLIPLITPETQRCYNARPTSTLLGAKQPRTK